MHPSQKYIGLVENADGTGIESVEITIPDDVGTAMELYESSPIFHTAVNMECDLLDIDDHYGVVGLLYEQGGYTWGYTGEDLHALGL